MAYNFIPSDIKELKSFPAHAELFEYLTETFKEVKQPIAIDKAYKNRVKVTRALQHKFNPKTYKSKYNLTINFGEGSRGSRGVNNMGSAFEHSLARAIKNYIIGEPVSTLEEKAIKDIFQLNDIKSYEIKDSDIKLVGKLNNKRPLQFNPKIKIGNSSSYDIGSVISDITISAKKPVYLSLKYGPTTTFFNVGVSKFFRQEEIKEKNITNKEALKLLDLFKIDLDLFCDVFNGDIKTKHEVDVTNKINRNDMEELIKSGIGYGYTLIHSNKNTINVYKIDNNYLTKASRLSKVLIQYGGAGGSAKRINMIVNTSEYILTFNIRNKSGGVYPNQLLCDYKSVK